MPRKTQEPEKVPPVHKAGMGALQLAVWANDHKTEEGETRTFHTITVERNYKDKNDRWQKSTQLRAGDIGDAIALLQNAQQFLLEDKAA